MNDFPLEHHYFLLLWQAPSGYPFYLAEGFFTFCKTVDGYSLNSVKLISSINIAMPVFRTFWESNVLLALSLIAITCCKMRAPKNSFVKQLKNFELGRHPSQQLPSIGSGNNLVRSKYPTLNSLIRCNATLPKPRVSFPSRQLNISQTPHPNNSCMHIHFLHRSRSRYYGSHASYTGLHRGTREPSPCRPGVPV